MFENIPISGPWITTKEIDYVADAAKNAWYSGANLYNVKFEKAFAEYIGVKYAMALPSCTSAIHLSLLALGIGENDEVIVPDITWIASAAPVSYVGAVPVFADIDEKSWCLSVESFKERITEKTKALILVDLYGNMPDMDGILKVANNYNIRVIEDAAEAIGSIYKDKKAGSFGETGVFSFHGTKTLTTGEGGMLVTNKDSIYERCLFLRDHGRAQGNKMFWNSEVAYKYKMSSLQAALGLAQLERVDELLGKKREIFSWYQEELQNVEGIVLNYEGEEIINSYWMVTIIWDERYKIMKEKMIEMLKEHKIDSRPFFYPLSMLPAYSHLVSSEYSMKNPISYRISANAINLPSALNLKKESVKYVCSVVKNILNSNLT